jgi:hypothetical protein
MAANDNLHPDVKFSLNYLTTGGLMEMAVFADVVFKAGAEKVQMGSADAIALCMLAAEALEARQKEGKTHG